ncbi:MAG: penicillin-binding protein 2 [Rhodospirillales bacterium]|nr:penicillin-binding protein 2 [Rhodospirillales bacterium]
MYRDQDRHKQFTRRALVLAGAKLAAFGMLGGRLYYLQVVESSRYATLAEDNRINLRLLPPPRGRILDRHGRPLALNRPTYRMVVVPEQAGDVEQILDTIAAMVGIDEDERRRILRDVARKRAFVPVTVRDDLAWEDVARIEVNAPDLPGIGIEQGQSRLYPHGAELAHVLGYVAAVSEQEAKDDPLLQLPDFRIGKSGIEHTYDLPLRGTGGRSEVEVNAYGRIIRELDRYDGEPGTDLRIAIDLELQQLAQRRLEQESGAVVVIDVQTGAVLALASNPSYDPSAFNRGLRSEEWRALLADPRSPLTNKAIAGQYAPGSTFKMVTALAGLERGVVSPDTRVFCGGVTRLGSHKFHCWKRWGHGTLDMRDAIEQSCDLYFYEVAKRAGVDRLAAMGHRLGLGHTLGIDLPGERTGLLPTRDWKVATLGQPWHQGETLIAGIGQGFVLSTPLQLAVMTARIANGREQVMPHVVRPGAAGAAAQPPNAGAPEPLGISPAHLQVVRDGMIGVVNGSRGTARRAAITENGMEMAGKTGTSQVRRITAAERAAGISKNEDLPWERRDHALFVGYAPIQAPRYAVAVIIEHGGGGSKAAAPVAKDILLAAQHMDVLRIARHKPGPGAGADADAGAAHAAPGASGGPT